MNLVFVLLALLFLNAIDEAKGECSDTDSWMSLKDHGYNCSTYAEKWCENGGAKEGFQWTLGSAYKNPENNCCACGKDRNQGCTDAESWKNRHGYDCSDYTQRWCENGGAKSGFEWALGSRYNYPENNCCACGKGKTIERKSVEGGLLIDGVLNQRSALVNLCTVNGNKGDGTVQGDCPSTAEVCLEDGTCSLREGSECSPEGWSGYKGLTCGPCSALVKIQTYGGTCSHFCAAQNMKCLYSWDDIPNQTCGYSSRKRSCSHVWEGTSDAVCRCAYVEQGLNPFVLLGQQEVCAPGFAITDAYRCNEAGHWTVSLGIFPMRGTQVISKSWISGRLPVGCSVQVGGDETIHFSNNTETNNERFDSGEFVMLCETDPRDQTFYVVDACNSENGEDDIAGCFKSKALTAGVRCCSKDGTTCATPPSCENDEQVTFDEAADYCQANYKNYELCTKDELLSGFCCKTGGSCNNQTVWTSTHISIVLEDDHK